MSDTDKFQVGDEVTCYSGDLAWAVLHGPFAQWAGGSELKQFYVLKFQEEHRWVYEEDIALAPITWTPRQVKQCSTWIKEAREKVDMAERYYVLLDNLLEIPGVRES